MSAPDALAVTMVAVLAFALGALATMFFVIRGNARRNHSRLELPEEEELQPATKASTKSDSEPTPEEWEKEADWWKKQ